MYQHLHWIVRMCVVRVSCQEEKTQQKRKESTRTPVSENGTVGIEFTRGWKHAQAACYRNTVNLEMRASRLNRVNHSDMMRNISVLSHLCDRMGSLKLASRQSENDTDFIVIIRGVPATAAKTLKLSKVQFY